MTEAPPIPTNSFDPLCDALMKLLPAERASFLMSLRHAERERIDKWWNGFAHPHQRAPSLTPGGAPWTTWLILGGRGAGKTRAGAEWVRVEAADPHARIALIGETMRDAREVMVEGVSGLLALHEDFERPDWISSRGRME